MLDMIKIKNFFKSIWKDNNIKKIILLFIVTRIMLFGVGYYAHNILPASSRMYNFVDELNYFGKVGTIFHGWDSGWYLKIANEGYPRIDVNALSKENTPIAFYPLYPLLIRFVGMFVGNVAGGIVVSNICFLMSCIVLYYLIRPKNIDLAYKSAKYLLVFPTSFIFSAIQNESLFLLLLLLVFFFLDRKKIWLAGFAGFLLALTRPNGFISVIPIGLYILPKLKIANIKNKIEMIFTTLLPFLGTLLHTIYLYSITGSFSAVLIAEKTWGTYFTFNLTQIYQIFKGSLTGGVFTFDLIISVVLLILLSFGSSFLGIAYGLTSVFIVLIYVFTTTKNWYILSFPRYFSILFPAYVGLGIVAQESKLFDFAATFTFLLFQMGTFFFWTKGFPVPM